MDDLPILAFEKVLSYLGLKQLLRARTVSKRWRQSIDHYTAKFPVRSLFVSNKEWPYIVGNNHLAAGEFSQNFICSPIGSLIGQPLLSNLKHLRVCDLDAKDRAPELFSLANSFANLESLDFFCVEDLFENDFSFTLSLLKLKSIRLDDCCGIQDWLEATCTLTLDCPRLSEIWIWNYFPRLIIEQTECVEKVTISYSDTLNLESFKNLKLLRCSYFDEPSNSLLSSLKHLKEIHFSNTRSVLEQLQDQKRRNGLNDLKIFYRGLCLDNPNDYPDSNEFIYDKLDAKLLRAMLANYSGVASEIAFYRTLYYTEIAGVQGVPADFWRRLPHLDTIEIEHAVRDVPRFLDVLSNCPGVRSLRMGGYPRKNQDLLDKLSIHHLSSQIQYFNVEFPCPAPGEEQNLALDFSFLLKFENLVQLGAYPIDLEIIPKVFNKLRFMRETWFSFKMPGTSRTSRCMKVVKKSNRFYLYYDQLWEYNEEADFDDIDQLMEYLMD